MRLFSDEDSLRVMIAVFDLTYSSDDSYVSVGEISGKSRLCEEDTEASKSSTPSWSGKLTGCASVTIRRSSYLFSLITAF